MPEGTRSGDLKENSFYIGRSEICVNASGERIGNGLFASHNYDSAQLIASLTRPLVASLSRERLRDTCANCFVWTEYLSVGSSLYVPEGTKVQACAGCKAYRYCSKKCQKEAWSRGHKHECKNFKSMAGKDTPNAVRATMEILVRRKFGLISDQAWQMLCSLPTHLEDYKASGKYEELQLMATGAGHFSGTNDTFPIEFITGMYGRVLSNSLTLITPAFDPLGLMFDPVLCHANHSCDPNAYIVMNGQEATIRSLRPVAKDEEILIAYNDTTNPYARRQSVLEARWFFTCRCSKCQKGPNLDEDNWAMKPGTLGKKWIDIADGIIKSEDWASQPSNYVGESLNEKRIAALQGKTFQLYEEESQMEHPAQAAKAIKEGMQLCHRSGLWNAYRQPYAALRDDLIVNLLTTGDFLAAWAHCAKRYLYIRPKLYPQSTHPIRVVQTWQMATLALLLASNKTQVIPGADMSVIAFMLVVETAQTSQGSHGKNNVFTMSIQRKLDEMKAEWSAGLGSNADAALANMVPSQRALLEQMGEMVE
ncbi:hypothetical protein EJ04DRAFT_275844 [Polyplosphaeria fusca]|uniref:MYND-type zinc finger protein samB n=1 Tax=Polyplosphaeria fusca TaxID=682080 RepID=A0A9P4V098_9PLEO|nr:hypothetical protein EJ04DRAFT_275844 [Polyplosphaeria fusca]